MASINLASASASIPIYDPAALRFFRGSSLTVNSKVGGKHKLSNGKLTIEAVKNLSLSINDGDRVALIGHNGAGKTTLLRLIAGIYPVQSGSIEVHGQCHFFGGLDASNPDGTGYENIELSLQIQKIPSRLHHKCVEDVKNFTELGAYLNMPMRTYSAGMVARLNFALATMFTPEILLIDEGIGAGDEGFKKKVEARLDRFAGGAKIVVCASHSEGLLRTLCNRGVVLQQGQCQFNGSLDEAFELYHYNILSSS